MGGLKIDEIALVVEFAIANLDLSVLLSEKPKILIFDLLRNGKKVNLNKVVREYFSKINAYCLQKYLV